MNEVKFGKYNPLINFIFFIGAIVFGMFFIHPAFLICSSVLSFSLLFTIKGSKAVKYLLGFFPLFLFISAVNPVFNTYGQTVLFTYFGGRVYTLEALCYGVAIAAMFVSMMVWFASYNEIMTTDKFLYIFGRFIPSISMIITMVLRFVPAYSQKIKQISTARMCIGKAGDTDDKRKLIEDGTTVLSALTSWALEGGIVTADSMRSRGYGVGKRTSFSVYRWTATDKLLCAVMLTLVVVIVFCAFNGGTTVTYTPELNIPAFDNVYMLVGVISYFIFLAIPTVLNITEEILWRILRSKI